VQEVGKLVMRLEEGKVGPVLSVMREPAAAGIKGWVGREGWGGAWGGWEIVRGDCCGQSDRGGCEAGGWHAQTGRQTEIEG
jgi:hypothetical protein